MKLISSLVLIWIWTLQLIPPGELAEGFAWDPGSSPNRTGRDVSCRENLEYLHAGICCLNCPAGTYVKQSCSRASERGVCQPCEFGSYTEHENGLFKCLQCASCRSDENLVKQCSRTRNTQCQCKEGLFCLPDQACEICKTCSRCSEDEDVEKICTPSSNTVCTKRATTGASAAAVIFPVLAGVLVVLVVIILYWKARALCKSAVASSWTRGFLMKSRSGGTVETRQNGLNTAVEAIVFMPSPPVGVWTPVSVEAVEEDDRGLGDSLPNTTTSSQNSLSVCIQPSEAFPARYSPALSRPPRSPENERRRKLIPVSGEESLKKSFDLFAEMDVQYHNRFFRHIGLSDNAIRNAESLSLEDKVYELLKVWMEKEGMKADFNTLIEALLYLNQRLSAENITTRAVSNGYFTYEVD